MEKLTTIEKLEAYHLALEQCEFLDSPFVCPVLREYAQDKAVLDPGLLTMPLKELKRLFPEFYKQKPKGKRARDAWWDYLESELRVLAIKKSIELIK